MALLTISLSSSADGRRVIRVALRSDADTMPHEHEVMHRQLVARLFPSSPGFERERPSRNAAVG